MKYPKEKIKVYGLKVRAKRPVLFLGKGKGLNN
jgi:hypothetical protein